jgi:hypothetical protein
MFSLFLALMALLLAAAAVFATAHFIGAIGEKGKASAEASALLAQGTQIVSASTAFMSEHHGAKPPTLEALVTERYLATVPPGWQELQGRTVLLTSKTIQNERACEIFNARQNIQGIPQCSAVGELTSPVCCQ